MSRSGVEGGTCRFGPTGLGEWAIALGAPAEFDELLTLGVVSSASAARTAVMNWPCMLAHTMHTPPCYVPHTRHTHAYQVSGLQRPERRAGVHLDRSVLYVATTATFMKGCGGCRESAGGRRGAGCQPLEATAPLPLWTSGRLPQLWASPTRVSRG